MRTYLTRLTFPPSAHTDADVELLNAAARQRLAAGQGEVQARHICASRSKGSWRVRNCRSRKQRVVHHGPSEPSGTT